MKNDLIIQKYFNNNLTSEEQKLFDSMMSNDIIFQEEVQQFKDLRMALRNEERISLKQEFIELGKPKKISLFPKMMVAASIALLLIIGSYFVLNDTPLSNQQLYTSNFEPYKNVMHPLVRGNSKLDKYEEAFVAYEQKDYAGFITAIENTTTENKDYQFYIANAYMSLGQAQKAETILIQYIQNDGSRFNTKAHWYLGLLYLNNDKVRDAKKHFLIVKQKGDYNLKKVNLLLKKLGN